MPQHKKTLVVLDWVYCDYHHHPKHNGDGSSKDLIRNAIHPQNL